ncbi:MAG: peptide chain release factor N(5)-glutamine methyltransferase [Proteobacteria bacterium]|nr:MAG: peptide chain release factor N(5)-glutamine methyltransferase [Pseudomonadota bacterium]
MAAAANTKTWTVLDLLRWTTQHFAERGIDTPRLDAECLLAHALGCDRLRLYVDFEKPVEDAERARFRELVRERGQARVPVALLVGSREFWSMPLAVTRDVLVPRPDTETLVAAALDAFPEREASFAVLDVGTGSGAIALAIARERPKALVVATDLSPAALAVARGNAERLGLADRIRFGEGSLFEPVAAGGERFDLVVSNPPYVAERDAASLAPELGHEPATALFAGPDGTDVLRPLAEQVADFLAPGGRVFVELDPAQAPRVAGWLAEAGLGEITTHRDAAGLVRVVGARRETQTAEAVPSGERME